MKVRRISALFSRAAIAGIAIAFTVVSSGSPSAGALRVPANEEAAPAHVRVLQAIRAYSMAHPDDYVGLSQAAVDAGGEPLVFSVAGADELLSAEQARDSETNAVDGQIAAVSSIPANAFEVSGYWSSVSDEDGLSIGYFGSYNFKPSYTSVGTPDDAFGVQTKNLTQACWTHEGDGGWVQAASGRDESAFLARKSADFDSAVYGVEDNAARSSQNVDHGTIYINYHLRANCSPVLYGRTYFEKNIDGCNCSWTAGITINGMSISYTGSDKPLVRQKSSSLVKLEI